MPITHTFNPWRGPAEWKFYRTKKNPGFIPFSSQSDYFVSTGALEMNLTDNVKIPDLV